MAMTREQKQKLAREAEAITHNLTVKTGGEIAKAFQAAKDDIDAQLIRWYMRYAVNEGVTLQEAQRQLTAGELKEFRMTVEEYIKKGRINAYTGEFETQLERASIARHVTRLEALKIQVAYSLEELRHRQSDSIQSLADTTYTDRYYRTLYGIHLDQGVGYTVDKVATSTINALMTVPWAPDGVGLSERIYKNTLKAEVEANREILQGFIQGKSVERMSRSLRERLDISHANANRLVRTESAHFANAATFDAYEKEEIEKYQFLATLDDRTSDICQSMDLQVFPVADMQEGVNAPPMHVNCRSTTVAFDKESKNDTRIARNTDGKNIQVPGDMSYKEWYDKYADKGSECNRIADELIKSAKKKDRTITPLLQSVANKNGVKLQGLKYKIKSKDSLSEKISRKSQAKGLTPKQYGQSVTDTLRYTIVSTNKKFTENYLRCVETLKKKEYTVIEVTNTLKDENAMYRGINSLVKDSSGYIFELQFHTEESLRAKELNHPFYEILRAGSMEPEREKDIIRQMLYNSRQVNAPSGVERIKDVYRR